MSGAATAKVTRLTPDRVEETGPEPLWLAEVRLRIARRVLWLRRLWSESRYRDEHLLAISHSEVDLALLPGRELSAAELVFYQADEQAGALSRQLAALAERPEDARLAHLVLTMEMSSADVALFKLAAAAAADHKIARVFGYLLDQAEAASPTPELAASLFALDGNPVPGPGPGSALVRWLLAEPVMAGADAFAASTGWRADAALLGALLGTSDWSAGSIGQAVEPPIGPALQPAALAEIVSFARQVGPCVEIELAGEPGSGRTALAAQATERLGLRLFAVDATAVMASADPHAAATREVRRARLEGSVIAWENAEVLPPRLREAIPHPPLAFASVPASAGHAVASAGLAGDGPVRRTIRCGPIGRRERIALWSSLAGTPAPDAVADWALRPGEIRVAAGAAAAGEHAVSEVCRHLLFAAAPDSLSPLPTPFTWTDLVLSEGTAAHLREFEARAQAARRSAVLDDWGFARLTPLGRGVTALLAGPPGTGKTMAAQVLARSVGLDLYRVDLAAVVSKYIGETEQHLRLLFDACERAPVMLLFDEADALFGKRTQVNDAHDRYANIEVDYVLQRMEQFDGIAILATNRKADLDSAFTRRLTFIVDFAPPTAAERERLWRIALECAVDGDGRPVVAGELDWACLGRDLDLTGAGVKSAAVAAAFLAHREGGPIEARHVLAAARRELAKQGIVVRSGQLGAT